MVVIPKSGPQGPQGPAGPAGPTGAAGPPLLYGAGAPAAGLGIDGQTYVDTAAGDWYQKIAGVWGFILGGATQAELDAHAALGVAAHALNVAPIGGGVSGNYLVPFSTGGSVSASFVQSTVHATPVWADAGWSFDRVSYFQSAAGSAGATVRLGVYADNGAGKPGALLVDAGVADASTGTNVEKAIAIAFTNAVRRVLWLAFVWQGGTTCPSIRYISTTVPFLCAPLGFTGIVQGYQRGLVAGALPDPITNGGAIVAGTGGFPLVALRFV